MEPNYRRNEIRAAIDEYIKKLTKLNEQKREIYLQELDAWGHLHSIINADQPKELHRCFHDVTRDFYQV